MIIAVIPAYNEFEALPQAVKSLRAQTVPPDRIIVALNNAKPGLLEAAEATGAEVVDLGPCPNMKAEALNKLLTALLPTLASDDLILVADADGVLSPTWIETAGIHINSTTVVGGIFLGQAGGGWIGRAQRNEYCSYAREVYARNDKAWVLTGTGTAFLVSQARAVLALRPKLYDETVATEDFELTLMFQSLGFRSVNPRGCEVTTEVMDSIQTLHDQRTRWYRGAVETIRLHGFSKTTRPYVWQQAKIVLGLALSWLALLLTVVLVITHNFAPTYWWLFALAPIGAKIAGGQHRWFSATVLPELIYDLFLQRALITGWWQALTHRNRVWNATEGN